MGKWQVPTHLSCRGTRDNNKPLESDTFRSQVAADVLGYSHFVAIAPLWTEGVSGALLVELVG
jgi:hypothetical protein